jgi:molybdopterin molybdotransferase
MITVAEARAQVLAATTPGGTEVISTRNAAGRVLATAPMARLDQPPFAVSAMDGYAFRHADLADGSGRLRMMGEMAAGSALMRDPLPPSGCVRVFTGAPLPAGADTVVIQEDTAVSGDTVELTETPRAGRHVRLAALDFAVGTTPVQTGKRLTPRDIGVLAAMDIPTLSVYRRPAVMLVPIGDELSWPGSPRGEGHIIASSAYALAALLESVGCMVRINDIVPDQARALRALKPVLIGHDLVLSLGGASVGDYDLVRTALLDEDGSLAFWKIAMRPGKPLAFGHIAGVPCLGLPGNPVSSYICALLFALPLLEIRQGLPHSPFRTTTLPLAVDMAANDRREDYVRASIVQDSSGRSAVRPFIIQDSSMQTTLALADGLIVRPAHQSALVAGTVVPVHRFGPLM